MHSISFTAHDHCPEEETALVDRRLGEFNQAAAPLHEVTPVCCFARGENGTVLGGAVGRRWGACCELQQLWVDPARRRQGLGSRVLQAFEAHARTHGCTLFFLETFSFQAPELYLAAGYEIAYRRTGYPHGIVKYHFTKGQAEEQAS